MSTAILTDAQSRILPALDRAALIAVLLTPLLLLHAHGIAEAAIAVTDACFLARSAIARDWTWLRTLWLRVGLRWWGWLVLCSPARRLRSASAKAAQARSHRRWPRCGFWSSSLALEHEVLTDAAARRWMFGIIAAAAAYIAPSDADPVRLWLTTCYGEPPGGMAN